MAEQWAVLDSKGVIAQGNEDEVRAEFDSTTNFTGDLLLVEIHAVRR